MTVEGFKDQGTYAPDNLIAGEHPRVERLITVASGAALTKGAVLGKITASSKYKLSASADSDGSEVPDAILAEDVDASGSDVEAVVYFAGEFNELALSFGTGHTAETVRTTLRDKNIYLRKNQSA